MKALLYNYLLTTVCTICMFEPQVVTSLVKENNNKVSKPSIYLQKTKGRVDPYKGRKPDVVSIRASINDYYKYDSKTKRYVWSE